MWKLKKTKISKENKLMDAEKQNWLLPEVAGVGEKAWNGWKGSKSTNFESWNNLWDVMYTMVTTDSNTVLGIWKLLRVYLKSSHHMKKKISNYVSWWMLPRLVVIISQYSWTLHNGGWSSDPCTFKNLWATPHGWPSVSAVSHLWIQLTLDHIALLWHYLKKIHM